jgi:LmbE family N-acetylglucosaminyl deacetylase
LVLVAHADDETLGAGGTLSKLRQEGWDVQVVVLADGVVTVRGSKQDNRPGAVAAAAILGIDAPRFMGFPDQRFDTVAMADLAGSVAALGLEPDLVITHAPTDLNKDHRLACDVAKIIARPRRKPVSILGCEIPNTTFWNAESFAANYYVDVSSTIGRKVQAFEKYTHEIQPYPHPWSSEGLRLLAQYHGMQCGFPMAEAFVLMRGYEGRLP